MYFFIADFFPYIDNKQPMLFINWRLFLWIMFRHLRSLLSYLFFPNDALLFNAWWTNSSISSCSLWFKNILHPSNNAFWVFPFCPFNSIVLLRLDLRPRFPEHPFPFQLFFLMKIFYQKSATYLHTEKTYQILEFLHLCEILFISHYLRLGNINLEGVLLYNLHKMGKSLLGKITHNLFKQSLANIPGHRIFDTIVDPFDICLSNIFDFDIDLLLGRI